jgi:elongation factor G
MPRPILSLAIMPVDPADREHLHAVLAAFSAADPSISVLVDAFSGLIRLRGDSLEPLLAICRRIEQESQIPIDFTLPDVVRIETIRRPAEGEGKYIRQTGGIANYAHVRLRLDPAPPGSGIGFLATVAADTLPEQFLAPIEEAIRESARVGIVAGCELTDLRVTLFDGSYHEADSNPHAFRIAASLAFQDAARQAHPLVLEPVMKVIFTVAESKLPATMAEISVRQGRVTSANCVRDVAIVEASIPLAEMLRDPGPAPSMMVFESFEPLPSGPDDGDPAASAVRNPRDPHPLTGSAAADPDLDVGADWT